MPAPVNVKLQTPTISSVPNWAIKEAQWMALNRQIKGNPDFYPLTIKAAYVIGIIHDICTSVTCLLHVPRQPLRATYIPAYGVCASGIELLGRCIQGNSGISGNVNDLKTGFKWLVSLSYMTVPDSQQLITTSSGAYDIETLAQLRHFAAHGQATARPGSAVHQLPDMDMEILGHVPQLIADGLERWWNELQHSEDLCNRLAKANILAFRTWPIFNIWSLFEKDAQGRYRSITEIFLEFDWRT